MMTLLDYFTAYIHRKYIPTAVLAEVVHILCLKVSR